MLLVMSLQALALVLVLVLVLAPQIALAGTPITAASLETVDNRTRVVLESASELRYKVLIFRYPERIVLELEEVALSPLLDGIARDNTNDGDGWEVRLHHFTGLEDHGYPTLYKYFAATPSIARNSPR